MIFGDAGQLQQVVVNLITNAQQAIAGDWTTAPGDDNNDGLTLATPMASLSALFQRYQFHQGDVIKVDDGTYNLSSNILLAAAESGITIEGFNDPANPAGKALLNRGNTEAGTAAIRAASTRRRKRARSRAARPAAPRTTPPAYEGAAAMATRTPQACR